MFINLPFCRFITLWEIRNATMATYINVRITPGQVLYEDSFPILKIYVLEVWSNQLKQQLLMFIYPTKLNLFIIL